MTLPLRNISRIDITQLTALTLSGMGSNISEDIFGSLPHIRTLTVKDTAAESFVQLIINEFKGSPKTSASNAVPTYFNFIALEILRIKLNWRSRKSPVHDFVSALGIRTSRLSRGLHGLDLLIDEEFEENEMLTALFRLVADKVTYSTEPEPED